MTARRFGGVTVALGMVLLLTGCSETPVPEAAPGTEPAAHRRTDIARATRPGDPARTQPARESATSPTGFAAPGGWPGSAAGSPGPGDDGRTDAAAGSPWPGNGGWAGSGAGSPWPGNGARPDSAATGSLWPGNGWPANGWPGRAALGPPDARLRPRGGAGGDVPPGSGRADASRPGRTRPGLRSLTGPGQPAFRLGPAPDRPSLPGAGRSLPVPGGSDPASGWSTSGSLGLGGVAHDPHRRSSTPPGDRPGLPPGPTGRSGGGGKSEPHGPSAAAPGLDQPTATRRGLPAASAAYPVGLRVLRLQRGRHRPLTTLVFYPAAEASPVDRGRLAALLTTPAGVRDVAGTRHGTAADASRNGRHARRRPVTGKGIGADGRTLRAQNRRAYATAGARPAAGRFPLIIFSHGLSSSPERFAPALAGWASAGFVVVAPTYPYTSEFTHDYRREDFARQPADARFVLERALRLDGTPGDPLRGRIDTDRIAAVGHSAGGYTTSGLFTAGHDPRLRAGVILAGWAAPGAFAGTPATMLFMQGVADPVVPMATSRAAFDRVPWPKAYLLMRRNSHGTYLRPGDFGFPLMWTTVTDFLRWTLMGDTAARDRLPGPAN